VKGNLLKYPGRKWLKHESLWSEPELRTYLPETELFSPEAFIQMIKRHSVLFLKPDLGMRGQGVLKVTLEGETCIIRTASNTSSYRNLKSAALKLEQLTEGKRYIVQQGIDLIRIKGHPVDFRVLLLKKRNGEWKLFGVMGKVAAPNRFVTNYSRGGKAIRLHQALEQTFGPEKQDEAKWDERIHEMSIKISNAMKKHFPNIAELGLDVAIDTQQRIWLIEANTRPQYQLFRHHSDPNLFHRISASVRAVRTPLATKAAR
jgi:glutathione synthase/RimK-type ligase-like ATP-grasp enzyme